jgi:hypothetical protein
MNYPNTALLFLLLLFAPATGTQAASPLSCHAGGNEMSVSADEGGGMDPASMYPASMLEDVVTALYRFDFRVAESLSRELLERHPGHYLAHFSRVYYNWWLMITWPRPAEVETRYRESILQALPLARKAVEGPASDQDVFNYINLHAMLARLDLQQGAWIRTMKTLRLCVVQVEKSMGREEAFGGFYLTSGLYNYLISEAIRRYPFLKLYALFYPEGDRERGISQLEKAFASDEALWKTEAGYFLMRIHLEKGQDARLAEKYASWLTTAYPSNLIFQYYHLQAMVALGDERGVREKIAEIRREAFGNRSISPEQRTYFLDLVRDY